jgi:hypothetical protein
LEELEEESELKYEKNFYNNGTGEMNDIRDLIKECPNCHELWMKTEGFSMVTCGEKIYHMDNLDQKDVLKYNFKI